MPAVYIQTEVPLFELRSQSLQNPTVTGEPAYLSVTKLGAPYLDELAGSAKKPEGLRGSPAFIRGR